MKIIAFYLPQFHEIPENNKWWGEGFTEWTNTRKANPLFNGHYQPREPLGDNYYNLLDNNVKKWQVDLAKEYGVYGFCFYHYWFKDGKKLLEKPIEQYLENKKLDLPFCLCWANESWNRTWDGSEKIILMPQANGKVEEWEEHFNYLLPFFKDERYIKIEDKPIFIIYRPEIIPSINNMLDYWQKLAKKNGLKGICFAYQSHSFHMLKNKDDSRFELAIEYEPFYSWFQYNIRKKTSKSIKEKTVFLISRRIPNLIKNIKNKINIIMDLKLGQKIKFRFKANYINKYSTVVNQSVTNIPLSNKSIPGVFTDWDNTARKANNSTLFIGSTPERFKEYLSAQIKRSKEVYNKDMVFVNAWNEWAEGAHLEPDKKHGYEYLEAVKEALADNGYFVDSKD
ncbi:MAG: glycoside hydrolase family 99-like domain-containing protein [Bacilli bacterium]|nr:glycoside hydrolase family 99-like domain-containing protein [Bacilli bacterium]MDD4809247.1 glycoside hydrolase family 99-like domain-containing protein [Bacilli bacterium]